MLSYKKLPQNLHLTLRSINFIKHKVDKLSCHIFGSYRYIVAESKMGSRLYKPEFS